MGKKKEHKRTLSAGTVAARCGTRGPACAERGSGKKKNDGKEGG